MRPENLGRLGVDDLQLESVERQTGSLATHLRGIVDVSVREETAALGRTEARHEVRLRHRLLHLHHSRRRPHGDHHHAHPLPRRRVAVGAPENVHPDEIECRQSDGHVVFVQLTDGDVGRELADMDVLGTVREGTQQEVRSADVEHGQR